MLFYVLQMQICPMTERVLCLMEISPSRIVCVQVLRKPKKNLLMCTTDCLHMLSEGKKNRKGKLAANTAKRPGSGYNHI